MQKYVMDPHQLKDGRSVLYFRLRNFWVSSPLSARRVSELFVIWEPLYVGRQSSFFGLEFCTQAEIA